MVFEKLSIVDLNDEDFRYNMIDEDTIECNGFYIYELTVDEYLIFTEEEWTCADKTLCANYPEEINKSFDDLENAIEFCLNYEKEIV